MNNNLVNLDVLVVYSASKAVSPSVSDAKSKYPFMVGSKEAAYNLTYQFFLQECAKQGLKAGFAASGDVSGAGECRHHWTYSGRSWHKRKAGAVADQIFDKLSPVNLKRTRERQLLLSDAEIQPFNDVVLFQTFFDKLLTFKKLAQFSLPTVAIKSASSIEIKAAVARLADLGKHHPFPQDFSADLVLKDRFGAGGNFVYKIKGGDDRLIAKHIKAHPKKRFILQPFLKFDQGFAYKGKPAATDIRLIYHHNKLLQCYIRMAKPKDFRCNVHQGGKIIYVSPEKIPSQVFQLARQILSKIDKAHSLFALDFAMSNGGRVYLIEGNIGPGINWDLADPTDEKMAKQLIRSIVLELSSRSTQSQASKRYQKEEEELEPLFASNRIGTQVI